MLVKKAFYITNCVVNIVKKLINLLQTITYICHVPVAWGPSP